MSLDGRPYSCIYLCRINRSFSLRLETPTRLHKELFILLLIRLVSSWALLAMAKRYQRVFAIFNSLRLSRLLECAVKAVYTDAIYWVPPRSCIFSNARQSISLRIENLCIKPAVLMAFIYLQWSRSVSSVSRLNCFVGDLWDWFLARSYMYPWVFLVALRVSFFEETSFD